MKLPQMSGKEVIAALSKLGFATIRQKGSHVFLEHPDGRTTLVPVHGGEDIDRSLLNKIIKKDLGMDVEEFLNAIEAA